MWCAFSFATLKYPLQSRIAFVFVFHSERLFILFPLYPFQSQLAFVFVFIFLGGSCCGAVKYPLQSWIAFVQKICGGYRAIQKKDVR